MKFKRLLLGIIVLLGIFIVGTTFSACDLERVDAIEFSVETVDIYSGEFDINDYKVIVKYSSGRVEELSLSEEMMSPSDAMKFYVVGEDIVTINYFNRTCEVNVKVRLKTFDEVVFNDIETTYTGEYVTARVTNVPEGTSVLYPNGNKFVNAGTYDVVARLRKDDYEFTELTARIVINKADYDLSALVFDDEIVEYDGYPKTLGITGELPEGLNVSYTIIRQNGTEEKGNTATSSGEYIIKASFSGDEINYNQLDDLTAKLTIKKARFDMAQVQFTDKTETYDMRSHSIQIYVDNLPSLVYLRSIEYYQGNEIIEVSGNGVVDAGVYKVIAKFSVMDTVNYELIEDMEATLTIKKAKYNFESIFLDSVSVDYDGLEHSVSLVGRLPETLNVTYTYDDTECSGKTHAGTYIVKAIFENSNDNYEVPETLSAELIINPIEINANNIVYGEKLFFDYESAKNHIPTGLPAEIETDKVVFYKTGLEIDNYDNYDGINGNVIEELTEDGYYVAIALFKENTDYTGLNPVKTRIKVLNCTQPIYDTLAYKLKDGSFTDENGNLLANDNDELRLLVMSSDVTSDISIDNQVIYIVDEIPENIDEFLSGDDLRNYGIKKIRNDSAGKYIVLTTIADCDGFETGGQFVTIITIELWEG